LIDTLKSKIINSPEWVISAAVFLIFWLVSKSYAGPTVLNDEIGYLANAALISGHIIDGATSYHAGYSFFLAPLFLIFSDPSTIWQTAMALNAFIWAVSFLLLARIMKTLVPEYSKKQLLMALLISALYPTWITMSGFVFTTTAFVFVFLLSVLTLLFWKPDNFWTIIPHCLLVGYLYWIHPVGLAVCAASFLVIGLVSIKEKRYHSVLLSMIILVALVTVYNEVVEKWLVLLATPEGYEPLSQHYPDSERILGRLLNYDYWLEVLAKAAGQISYLAVSSFGFILFGFMAAINKSYRLFQPLKTNYAGDNNLFKQPTFAYLALSLLAVLAMGVMFLSIGGSTRVDQWIYGRYAEMVVLPLLALGFLAPRHKKGLLFAAGFVFLTGLYLNQLVDKMATNLTFTTVAFWPQYIIVEYNYLYWMAAGAIGLVLVNKVRKISSFGNALGIVCILAYFVSSAAVSSLHHHNRVELYHTPSSFVDIIRENYQPGTCVGFNLEGYDSFHNGHERPRYYLHLFYLYDYEYRRMSPEEWLNSCNGPYLTYDLNGLDHKEGVKLVGKEVYYNLYMLTKDDGRFIDKPDLSNSVEFID